MRTLRPATRAHALALALACVTMPLAAQVRPATGPGSGSPAVADQGGLAVGVFGGGTFPVGDMRTFSPTGWNAGAYVDIGRHVGPFGVRLEGAYHGFGDGDVFERRGGTTAVQFTNRYSAAHLAANLVFGIPANWSAVRPYATGGVGAYWLRNSPQCAALTSTACSGSGSLLDREEDWRFGLNGGFGIEFGLGDLSAFAEARYHHALRGVPNADCLRAGTCTDRSPAQYVPVTAGLIFRF